MPYDTQILGVKIFAELLSHTCDNRYFSCLLLWALYLTPPATIFKTTSVSCVVMAVLDNKLACATLNLYDCSNVILQRQFVSRHP